MYQTHVAQALASINNLGWLHSQTHRAAVDLFYRKKLSSDRLLAIGYEQMTQTCRLVGLLETRFPGRVIKRRQHR